MAETSGSQMPNEGQACPQASTEYCSGPYALFASGSTMGQDNVFPTGGFTVTDDLYLSPSTAAAGNLVDDDVDQVPGSSGARREVVVIRAVKPPVGNTSVLSHGRPEANRA